MDNQTVLNTAISNANATVINQDVIEEYNRQNNISNPVSMLVSVGTVFCEKYKVQNQLEVDSGEADLYLCSDGSSRYVAKVYRRKSAIKAEVVETLKKINSPYVARVYDSGIFQGYPVVIIPYYEKGSLQGQIFTEDELIKTIIPCINEGLHVLHESGIVHKDLKPSNIMVNNDGKTVSIIDFGISSILEEGSNFLITRTGMTPAYSAPETFRNITLREADYYSFGITLFELLCGYTPYANLQQEEIEQYVSLQSLQFPDEISPLMQDFISALTYYDITKREQKDNPSIRIARDMFALLPINHTIVHAVMDNQTMLSVDFDREKLSSVKFGYVDPSDTMEKFNHHMDFSLDRGCFEVERITLSK